MNKSLLKLAGVLLLALSVTSLRADLINGNISFGGTAVLNGSVSTATTVTSFSNTHVETADGDFGAIAVNAPATFASTWNFGSNGPQTALWSVGGFTFDLSSSTTVVQTLLSGALYLSISGVGMVSGNGYDATTGAWAFGMTDAGPTGGSTFSFSATAAVPDGSTTALLVGIGLVGMSFIARRRK